MQNEKKFKEAAAAAKQELSVAEKVKKWVVFAPSSLSLR